jgi:hypothetical protein
MEVNDFVIPPGAGALATAEQRNLVSAEQDATSHTSSSLPHFVDAHNDFLALWKDADPGAIAVTYLLLAIRAPRFLLAAVVAPLLGSGSLLMESINCPDRWPIRLLTPPLVRTVSLGSLSP